jgi:hypothetical protein
VLKPDVFFGLYRPVLAGLRISFHLVDNRHKVSVKADVYHFVQSGIPNAGIAFQAAGSVSRIGLVDFAPADAFHALEIFAEIPVNVSDVVHFIFSFTSGVLPSF